MGDTTNLAARAVLPLVGQRAEAELLCDAVAGLRDGKGRAVSLSGDAGSGRSRLLDGEHGFAADDFRVGASGETHTAATAYAPWQHCCPRWRACPSTTRTPPTRPYCGDVRTRPLTSFRGHR